MDEFNMLFIFLGFLTSCRGQSYPPTNVTAVYVADGSIKVTWEPPVPGAEYIDRYYVEVEGTGVYGYVQPNNRVYLYNNTDPDTRYTIGVRTILSDKTSGPSQTTITTPKATYRQKGTNTRLEIPKPPGGLSSVKFNGQTIFRLRDDNVINSGSTPSDGVIFSVTSSNTELIINGLETKHAGYYYIMRQSEGTILGGELLVVTDTPTRPTIMASSPSPVVNSSVTLLCSSSSQSKPDNHGLTLTSSWKLNGSDVTRNRLSVNGISLIINPVRFRDKYNVYTCVVHEAGPEVSKLSSEESGEFKLTPRYGPQFVRIEGAEGQSPIISGDDYGPVLCITDCYPDCQLEWRRQGQRLISSSSPSNNELELVDHALPRLREITYTCRVTSSFTPQTQEKNITVKVYFPPEIKQLSYRDGNSYQTVDRYVHYTEGSDLDLRVYVDSNPRANVTLLRNKSAIAIGVISTDNSLHDIKVINLQCNQTGTYDVIAENLVTRNRSNAKPAKKEFSLQVRCSPRRYNGANGLIEIAGKKGEMVTLNVTVIANPPPQSHWSDGALSTSLEQINDYTYTIRREISVSTREDFRDYHVNITNRQPDALIVYFKIRQEDVPDGPVDFRASDISYDNIKVTWTSGFNGGKDQLFHIEVSSDGEEWQPYLLNITDEGHGIEMARILDELTPSSNYVIRLNVSNEIGFGNFSVIEVRTHGKPQPISAGLNVTYIIIPVIIILILVVVVVGIMFLRRRKHQQGGAVKKSYVGTTENEYANTPRGGAAVNNTMATDQDNNEYAVVCKPAKGGAARNAELNTDNDNNEYAVVSKPAKGQKQNKKNGGPTTDPSTQEPQPGPSRTVNQDGLIYIDVEIKPQPGRGKGVIHGADDRTPYAMVDFSRTAPVIDEDTET